MVNEVSRKLGRNLRWAREIRGYTLTQLADLIGDPAITEKMLGAWERGETRIYADQLISVCGALGVTPNRLILGHPAQDIVGEDVRQLQLAAMPERDKASIIYARTRWLGNARALGQYLRMYLAFETRQQRYHLMMHNIKYFHNCLRNGMVPRLDVDIDYIERSCKRLRKEAPDGGEEVAHPIESESDG